MSDNDLSMMLIDYNEYKKNILRLKAENRISKKKLEVLELKLREYEKSIEKNKKKNPEQKIVI